MTKTTLKAQSQWLAKRKLELGVSGTGYVPSNDGGRRSPSKRSLLAKLRKAAQESPVALKFKAKF